MPADTGLDGELVVWEADRLAFERLQQRLARRGTGASQAAGQWPAHYVAFDLLHQGERDLTGWPYWTLPQPMLTVAVDSPALPAGWAGEPKWEGGLRGPPIIESNT
ncbi:hypothetical protein ACIGAN_26110 [Streptomyces sp. NPDC085931]|uniref:hypothetical protein n=1 Tax=Streptomyces sp. NPDC085931 TaxID=3365740 RepID=UPI0037D7FF08